MRSKRIAAAAAALAIASSVCLAYSPGASLVSPLNTNAIIMVSQISEGVTADGFKYGVYGVCDIMEDVEVISRDYVAIKEYSGKKASVTIPETIEDLKVTEICKDAFAKNEKIVSVSMPDSVTTIGDNAFWGCSNLAQIKLSANLEVISQGMFQSCGALQSVDIPDSVLSIGSMAFNGCSSLTEIVIPDSVINIGESDIGTTFGGCKNLTSVKLPKGLTVLTSNIFMGCSSLTSIELPDSIKVIDSGAFSGCTSLNKIKLPAKLTTINSYAFEGCAFSEFSFPKGIKTIAKGTFENCESLKHMHIPTTVEQIESRAFAGCKSLKNINIPVTVKSVGEHAFGGNYYWYLGVKEEWETYSDAAITGEKGSAAEKFAADNKIKFHILGDANGDKALSAADLVALQKQILGAGKVAAWQSADVNDDGIIDTFDLVKLRQLLVKNGVKK